MPTITEAAQRRVLWALYGLIALAALAPVLIFGTVRRPPSDHVGDFERWPPTRAAVEKELGVAQPGDYRDLRHRQYVALFKRRFRDQETAVGIRFADQRTLEVLCAAMIPRWDMARIALMAKDEADRLFSGDHRVRIYETYISTMAHQVGEIHSLDHGRVRIDFGQVYPSLAPRVRPVAHNAGRHRLRPPVITLRPLALP